MLIHGSLIDGPSAWAPVVGPLSASHRLLVLDRRGHGRSPEEPRPYTFKGDAEDALEAADRLGAASFHLAGHSYGGLAALELARLAPERILSLHLIEPPYLRLLDDDDDVQRLLEASEALFERAPSLSAEEIAEAFVSMVGGEEALARVKEGPGWPVIVREAARARWEEPPSRFPADRVDELRIDCPVQVYAGSRSHPGLQRLARRLAARLERATFVEVDGAGHTVQQAVEPFVAALRAVTARVDERRRSGGEAGGGA